MLIVAERRIPYELIVVDNAFSDGSAEPIGREFSQICLIAETENHGFAKANNIAAQHAREHILLLNPDTVVLDSAIDELVAFARAKPEAKFGGGRTLHGDRTLNNQLPPTHNAVESLLPGRRIDGTVSQPPVLLRSVWRLGHE
jgi:GT2 family glycosyltransferase